MSGSSTVTVVAGFGRCGSSLVMQMLQRAGVPPTGQWPSFEDRLMESPADFAWMAAQGGGAVKLLFHGRRVARLGSDVSWRTIWLDRQPRQQAMSQVKMLTQLSDLSVPDGAVAQFARSYRADRPRALRELRRAGPVLVISFERLIRFPERHAGYIAEFVGKGCPAEMARAVLPRSVACQAGFDIEAALLESPPAGIGL